MKEGKEESAILKESRQYARQFNELSVLYNKESDRAAAVLAVSFLDVKLGEALGRLLVDNDATKHFLKRNIKNFYSRIELAYCLGYLPRTQRDDMHRLREIRNFFAHHPGAADFSSAEPKRLCDSLENAEKLRKDGMPPRQCCLMAVAICLYAIAFLVKSQGRPTVPPFSNE